MATLDQDLYIIVNTVDGYVEPGTNTSDIPKLYSLAGAKRSLTHKRKWAEKVAEKKGETVVRDNWAIKKVTVHTEE